METAESLLVDVIAAQRRLDAPAAERCTTTRRLAFAAERAGHPEAALDALREATRFADDGAQAEIVVDRVRLLEKLGRYRSALALTARAIKDAPDRAAAAHVQLARASIYNFQGRWAQCLAICDDLLGRCGADGRSATRRSGTPARGMVLRDAGAARASHP